MCEECGCENVDIHRHDHHSHTLQSRSSKKLVIEQAVMLKNDSYAEINRKYFHDNGIYAINLISSPGSGKTTIVEYLARHFGNDMAVIVGDIQTHRDAERARAAGCHSIQIETLGACHLDAHSILHTLQSFNPDGIRLLVIENVGNLVCPSSFDLGENEIVAVLSVPEGDDKVLKYPAVFHKANTLLINKIDLTAYVKFDKSKVITESRSLNRKINVFEIAAVNGLGMNEFIDYLNKQMLLLI